MKSVKSLYSIERVKIATTAMAVATIAMLFAVTCMSGCAALASLSTPPQAGQSLAGDSDRPKVMSTIFASFDFARQIGGENIEVSMLIPPGSETHSFEPTPQDMLELESCDLFICAGGESDAWIEGILDVLQNKDIRVIRMIDCVEVVHEDASVLVGSEPAGAHEHSGSDEHAEPDEHAANDEHAESDGHAALDGHVEPDEHTASDEHAGSEGHATSDEHTELDEHAGSEGHATSDEHTELDEHVWTSVLNAAVISEDIAAELIALDPENAHKYRQNLESYLAELDALHKEFTRITTAAAGDLLVFGDRFPFQYFADDYNLTCRAAYPGCSTASDVSAKTVAALIDIVRSEDVDVVLYRELSNHSLADAIAADTGAQALEFQSCHNISKQDLESGATYVSLMYENAAVLERALG